MLCERLNGKCQIRCLIVAFLCWISIGVWLSWDCLLGLFYPDKYTFHDLSVYLAFAYLLVPLIPATFIATLLAFLFRMSWLYRGIFSGVVCSGIVILFFVSTQQTGIIFPTVLFFAGFLIGVSAKVTKRD